MKRILGMLLAALLVGGCVSGGVTRINPHSDESLTIITGNAEKTWKASRGAFAVIDRDGLMNVAVDDPASGRMLRVGVEKERWEQTPEGYRLEGAMGTVMLRRDEEPGEQGDRMHGRCELRIREGVGERFARVSGELTEWDAMVLIATDCDEAYIDRVTAEPYGASWTDLARLRAAGVSADFVVAMRRARSTPLPRAGEAVEPTTDVTVEVVEQPRAFTVDEIIYLRQRGISADYVEAMQNAGYRFDAREFSYLRSRGISAEFAADWRRAGYRLTPEQLSYLRSRGIAPEFGKQLREAGYILTLEQLSYLRSRGISGEYAAGWREAGYVLTPEQLSYLRSRGVSVDFGRRLREAGYGFSPEQLSYLRSRGVSADYAVAAAVPGLEPLSAEELSHLRSRGVEADMVRRLRQPASSR